MSANPFAPATKRAVRARIAFDGPSGAGKTWTSLEWATVLAQGGPIAVVDTERRSASLYAGRFDFDALEMSPPYHPQRLIDAIGAAEANGYAVLVVDSLSHFWSGEGGVLDIVDDVAARSRSGNSFTAWKEGTPVQRAMVDRIVSADMHVIVTMRTKQEWVIEEDSRGKKVPRRVGMQAEQRGGLEYEFTMVGDLDLDHMLTFSKSRCDRLSDTAVKAGAAREAAETFLAWLEDGTPLADRNTVDSLVGALNQVVPDEARKEAKRAFVDRFGSPDTLTADRVDEAREFVSDLTSGATPADGPPDDGDGDDQGATDDGDELIDRETVILLSKWADRAWPLADFGRGKTAERRRYRRALTAVVTGGRTAALDALTPGEASRLEHDLSALTEGVWSWEAGEDALVVDTGEERVVCPWVPEPVEAAS